MNTAEQIKNILGDTARDIIVSDLHLQQVADKYTCPYPSHPDNNPSAEWLPYAFHCYSCGEKQYDIFTHYEYYHGIGFAEAIDILCRDYGIQNTYNPGAKPKKVVRVKVDEEYAQRSSQMPNVITEQAKNFFQLKGINEELVRRIFFLRTTETEVLIDSHEVIGNVWQPVCTKRRKLNGEKYVNTETKLEAKEIQIKGGQMVFFGLPSLYKSDGTMKQNAMIFEGMIDAMRFATELDKVGQLDKVAILSVPNGGASLINAFNNTPFFRKWYMTHCKKLIFCPDADATGLKMIEQAQEVFGDARSYWMDITKLDGIDYTPTKGYDVSDALDQFSYPIESLMGLVNHLPMKGLMSACDAKFKVVDEGIKTGFLTHDFNDRGCKMGRVTILSGTRGQGKTTLARQIVMNAVRQDYSCFCFFGESSTGEEVDRFARMCSKPDEITSSNTDAGRIIYNATDESRERFKRVYGSKIVFYDRNQIEEGENVFDDMMKYMVISAERGCKLFLIDNMMMITSSLAKNVFTEQARVVKKLKDFAVEYDVHVLLVAHPRAGDGMQKISGAQEQENLVDTILYYVRIDTDITQDDAQKMGIPMHEIPNVSATLINKKVRDEGTAYASYMEWIPDSGTVREITSIQMPPEAQVRSKEYFLKGWWSRPVQEKVGFL